MTAQTMTVPQKQHRSIWRRWIADPVVAQLRQGITPEKIALTIAAGCTVGVFPVLGSTTILCAAAGVALRLNQPILQGINYLLYPVQIALIFVFIRIGEWIYRAPPLRFSIPQMLEKFSDAPGKFFSDFAMTFVHAITAWVLVAPICVVILYYAVRPVLRAAAAKVKR